MPEVDKVVADKVVRDQIKTLVWLNARVKSLEEGELTDASQGELALLYPLRAGIGARSTASDDASLTDRAILYWLASRLKVLQYWEFQIKLCFTSMSVFYDKLSTALTTCSSLEKGIAESLACRIKDEFSACMEQFRKEVVDHNMPVLASLITMPESGEGPLATRLESMLVAMVGPDGKKEGTKINFVDELLSYLRDIMKNYKGACVYGDIFLSRQVEEFLGLYNAAIVQARQQCPSLDLVLPPHRIVIPSYSSSGLEPAVHNARDFSSAAPSAPPPSVIEWQAALFGGKGVDEELGLFGRSKHQIRGPGSAGPG